MYLRRDRVAPEKAHSQPCPAHIGSHAKGKSMNAKTKANQHLNNRYEGPVYIGVVGPEEENGVCRDSIENIQRREGDSRPVYIRATKGFEARQIHLDNFKREARYSFLLLLDHDQIFPPDTLERLRSHKLPYVSGYYMRRRYQPIMPVWFTAGKPGVMPMYPMTSEPERGKLHPLGASGWGCILVHREVIEAVQPLLKGEAEIIEDDMDVYPYDLPRIMTAIKGLEALAESKPEPVNLYPAMEAHIEALREEIRPLRVMKDNVGSDIRFPFYARLAGYQLYGDPDVRCGHMLNYPLSPDDFATTEEEYKAQLRKQWNGAVNEEKRQIIALRKGLE